MGRLPGGSKSCPQGRNPAEFTSVAPDGCSPIFFYPMVERPDSGPLVVEFMNWRGFTTLRAGTQENYRRHLEVMAVELPSFVSMTRTQLRAWDQRQRGSDSVIGQRHSALKKLCKFMVEKGYREDDPTDVLVPRRGEGRPTRTLTRLGEKRAKLDAAHQHAFDFLYHTGLRVTEAYSVRARVPVESPIHVNIRGRFQEIPINRAAIRALEALGGRLPGTDPGKGKRNLQRKFQEAGFEARELRKTALRDHQMTGQGADVPLVIARLHEVPRLTSVEMSLRKALLEMQPGGDPGDAITDAGRVLEDLLEALGAKGSSLGPLLDDARDKGLLGPRDTKLLQGVHLIGDWISSQRNVEGDAHRGPEPDPEDAWLMIRVVGAMVLRLMARGLPD